MPFVPLIRREECLFLPVTALPFGKSHRSLTLERRGGNLSPSSPVDLAAALPVRQRQRSADPGTGMRPNLLEEFQAIGSSLIGALRAVWIYKWKKEEKTGGCRSGSGVGTRIGCLWMCVCVWDYVWETEKWNCIEKRGIGERTTTAPARDEEGNNAGARVIG